MTAPEFKYDVALSFLAEDEPLAQRIAELLAPRLNVFLYSERQRELAGRDGMGAFSQVYGGEARMVAVLYRPKWGETKWTRIEREAIRTRAYEEGWDFTVFVVLDGSEMPRWLPPTRLWQELERFGVEGAAAVLEARVRDAGATVREETVADRLHRELETAKRQAELKEWLASSAAVSAAEAAVREVLGHLEALVAELRDRSPETAPTLLRPDGGNRLGVSVPRASFVVGWRGRYVNSLDDSWLYVEEDRGPLYLDRWPGHDRPLRTKRLRFAIDDAGRHGWRPYEGGGAFRTSQQVAEDLLSAMFAQARKDKDAGGPTQFKVYL